MADPLSSDLASLKISRDAPLRGSIFLSLLGGLPRVSRVDAMWA